MLLNLSGNKLTGRIPTELARLSSLQEMNLAVNKLTGNIPPELGQLSNLRRLHLRHNKLTGTIPAELGRLSNLDILELADNRLTGNIPPELGQLTNLNTLNLRYNGALSGTLPAALTGLPLENLRLEETLLCPPRDAENQGALGPIDLCLSDERENTFTG